MFPILPGAALRSAARPRPECQPPRIPAYARMAYPTCPDSPAVADFLCMHNGGLFVRVGDDRGHLDPIGVGLCRLSRRRELRLYGVLRSSPWSLRALAHVHELLPY